MPCPCIFDYRCQNWRTLIFVILAQETEARQRGTLRAIYKILSEERDRWLIELRKP